MRQVFNLDMRLTPDRAASGKCFACSTTGCFRRCVVNARDEVIRRYFQKRRYAAATARFTFETAIGKATFVGEIDRAHHFALERNAFTFMSQVRHGNGRQKCACIRVQRVVEQFFGRCFLDDGA